MVGYVAHVNTPRQPSRPDAATFRRRRIVAVLILIVVLAGIVAGAVALKNVLFPAQAEPVEQEPETEADQGPSEEELANPEPCAGDAVQITVNLPADSVTAGQTHTIPVEVHNSGEVPCLIDLGRETVSVEITSGGDQVWSTKHCGGGLPKDQRVLLDADETGTATISWPGTRSASGCPDDQPSVDPGTYRLRVALDVDGDKTEEEQVFGVHS